jgi:hypothetical protein
MERKARIVATTAAALAVLKTGSSKFIIWNPSGDAIEQVNTGEDCGRWG